LAYNQAADSVGCSYTPQELNRAGLLK